MRWAYGSTLRLTSDFSGYWIPPGECINMSRVRLFPGFSTAVLQTGPPTLGVRLKCFSWKPLKKFIFTSNTDKFACVWS
jgi:hypothetical protein